MQRFFTQTAFLFSLLTALVGAKANAATMGTATVTSSNGYTVTVTLTPVSVVLRSSSGAYGYNYDLNVDYTITYSGSNIPGNAYTLQAAIGCLNGNSGIYNLPLTGTNSSGTVTTTTNSFRPVNDYSTATPATLSCTDMKLTISAPGINSQVVAMTNSVHNGGTLPIHLSDFSAVADGDKVDVAWTTAMEMNVGSYTVQRSTNGVEWNDLAIVASKGNTDAETHYSYSDVTPVTGKNYYRLKETDKSGEVSYYNSVLAQILPTTGSVRIYPNPNSSNTIHVSGITDAGWSLTVSGTAGQATGAIPVTEGGAQLPDMPAGMYFIKLTNSATQQVLGFKYMKQ